MVSRGMAKAPLAGRDDELHELAQALGVARAGVPTIVTVEGEAGLGKTRLVSEAAARLRRPDELFVTAHGVDLVGGQLSFGLVAEAVRSVLRERARVAAAHPGVSESPRTPQSRRGRPSTQDVVAFPPAAHGLVANIAEPGLGRTLAAESREEVFDGFTTLLEAIVSEYVVWLAVDDVQWADESSLELFEYVGRVVTAGRLLTTYTVRIGDGPPTPAFAKFRTELKRAEHGYSITLAPLDREATAALAGELIGARPSPDLLARVYVFGEGNPFLTEELIRGGLTAAGALPESPQELMLSRVQRLSDPAALVVRVTSLAYALVTPELLARVLGYDADVLDAALDEAVARRILDTDGNSGAYRFHHALMKEAVNAAIPPGQRRRWHRAWAEALAAEARRERDTWQATIAAAHHWLGGAEPSRAFDACLLATDQATAFHAPSERAPLLAAALALWDRVPDAAVRAHRGRDELVIAAIRAAHFAGDWAGALDLIEAELRHSSSDQDPVRRATLELSRQGTLEQLHRAAVSDFSPRVDELAQLLLSAPDGPWLSPGCLEASWRSSLTGDSGRTIALAERAAASARAQDDPEARLRAGQTLADTLASQDRLDEAFAVLDGLMELTGKRIPERLSDVEAQLSWFLSATGRLTDGAVLAERAIRRIPFPQLSGRLFAYVAQSLAHAITELGRWEEADHWLTEALEVYPDGWTAFEIRAMRIHLACCRGDVPDASGMAQDLWQLVPHDERGELVEIGRGGTSRMASAALAAVVGDLSALRELLAPVWAIPQLEEETDSAWRALLIAAKAEADAARRSRGRVRRSADLAAANAHIATLAAVGARLHSQGVLGPAWRQQLAADIARYHGDQDLTAWRDVRQAWRAMGARHDEAWALLRMAECHVIDGDRTPAQAAATVVIATARELGARPLEQEAISFAGHARLAVNPGDTATPATTPQSAIHGLTGREREILHLLALGHSNDQIAKTLFISPRTVSVHVSRVLAKLGVASRSEATALAFRHGLSSD